MADCIFCKIIKGEIPSVKLLETDKSYSFLDIGPLSRGHSLIIPKEHQEKMHQLSDDSLTDILVVAKKIALAQGIKDYNILQNNGKIAHQVVMHVHFHLIPKTESNGLRLDWKPKQPSHDEIKELGNQIRAKL